MKENQVSTVSKEGEGSRNLLNSLKLNVLLFLIEITVSQSGFCTTCRPPTRGQRGERDLSCVNQS